MTPLTAPAPAEGKGGERRDTGPAAGSEALPRPKVIHREALAGVFCEERTHVGALHISEPGDGPDATIWR
jgi:hypothetical protein